MSTFPPERQDDDADITELLARTVDGSQSDEPADPAMEAVIEAGGGVAEGFEQSEAALVDNATFGPDDGTDRIPDDAFDAETEADRAVYAEPDVATDGEREG
jgi:hypothetical protein